MEGSIIDLSKYRYEAALDDLDTAKVLLRDGKFKASVNRSYYAIFHALRSVTALDQFDSSKHSGVIAFFNRTYVKEGIFDKSISKMIDTAFRLREKADYILVICISRKANQGSPADFFVQQGGWISSPSKKLAPQLHMASSTGIMLRPKVVKEYMVLGGLAGMTSLCIIPHSSKSCNCCDSIFGVAFGIMRCNSM